MGEVFAGRYELVDPIGRGGVGAVWRAFDHRRRRYVAAKVLQQSDAHSLLRFVREQALRIDHPHVLAPASWAADDDKVLFTMDLVAGGSLVHLVGDYGPLPPSFVCTLLDQLLAGLAAVHAEGVVHRDIKPANLLLEATGTGRPRLRLSDFGIAMRLGEPRLTETNLVVGTPGYLAPEQLMGAEPDFPADLFAVGLVALYLLEGAKADAKALVQYFTTHGTPGAPTGIPEPLWQVVASLLQPDPHARFRTATGARKALAAATELLPEPGPDDEIIEIFDQLGPLPTGFVPEGPLKRAPGIEGERTGSGQFRVGEGSVGTSSPANGTGPDPRSLGSVPSGTEFGAAGGGYGAAGAAHGPSGAGHGASGGGSGSVGGGQVAGSGPGPVGGRPGSAGTGRGTAGTGSDAVSGDPRHVPAGQTPPVAEPPSSPQQRDSGSSVSMSDTGSFHLPLPQSTGSSPQAQTPPPQPYAAQGPAQGPVQGEVRRPAGNHGHPHENVQHHPADTPLTSNPATNTPQGSDPPANAPRTSNPPANSSPYDTTHVLSSPRPHTPQYPPQPPTTPPQHQHQHQHQHQRVDASTASYTAQSPQVPPSAPPVPQPRRRGGHRAVRRAARGPARRPGPPAKVALPLLLLALACYAVGFWALAQL
ncbi:serine/threonine-protein kinase [Streptomyces sp. Y7]|uniref:serine/threonine-protein kinase n=1 Tax=Streptomyces sp. Y7 TaxID=3342392 RepID=UPI0037100427